MAHVIVADGNEGRRSLLANTLEREGFQVTRASTLRQAVGTTVATVPEVLLLEEVLAYLYRTLKLPKKSVHQ